MTHTIADTQILDAALDVIAQKGYAGATTRQIAAAAGINEVTLFRRFGSKQKLLAAAIEQEAEHFTTLGIEYTGDLEADLQRVVRFYRDLMHKRGRMIAMLITEIPRQPELIELLQTPLSIIGTITAMIARYQREGALVEEPPMQAFVSLVGPLFMGGVIGLVHPDAVTVSFNPAEQVRRYLHGRAR
jgi:AcrR family transcriptional regulator